MNTAMYDAREALATPRATPRPTTTMEHRTPGPGLSSLSNSGPQIRDSRGERERGDRLASNRHDPLTYIGPDSHRVTATPSNLHIPVGIFMNMAHVPPRFYNQHQQMLVAAQGKSTGALGPPQASSAAATKKIQGGKTGRYCSQGDRGSQDISQGYSQGPLTQGLHSQSGLSQGLQFSSQGDLSQDSVLIQPDLHSQLDNLLSQDSTYQGDRYASQNQFLSQFSQVCRVEYSIIGPDPLDAEFLLVQILQILTRLTRLTRFVEL